MVPLEIRKGFVEKFLVDEYDRPIRLMDWSIDHIINPLDGFKLWRADPKRKLCKKCIPIAGTVVLTRKGLAARLKKHGECGGLLLLSVIVVVINLKRQQGKTTAGEAYALSELFLGRNQKIVYMAASEDQAQRIFEAKFAGPIRKNPELARRVKIGIKSIINEERGNSFRFIASSAKSAPGGTSTLIIIDEARDVDAKTAVALMPQILGAKGLGCPEGHYSGAGGPEARTDCPTCGADLIEWMGKLLIMSSAGDDEGWFRELVEKQETSPMGVCHLFRSDATLNPNFNVKGSDALDEVFGDLPSMAIYLQRELHNVFAREGDEFLKPELIEACRNSKLTNEAGSKWRCVAFLDCSKTTELTSLVICGDPMSDPRGQTKDIVAPFTRLITLRIEIWDPKKMPKGRIDDKIIRARLAEILPKFPRLVEVGVDINMVNWAEDLVDYARTKSWGRMFVGYRATQMINQDMWESLERRFIAGRNFIQIPGGDGAIAIRLKKELKAARIRELPSGRYMVMDSRKGNRRGKMHRDVAMSLAGCAYLADIHSFKGSDESIDTAVRINESIKLAEMKQISAEIRDMAF